MAAAVLTRSAMQFHLLVLSIVIYLSCFGSGGGYDEETCLTYPLDQRLILNAHNVLRYRVNPSASNMRRMVCLTNTLLYM